MNIKIHVPEQAKRFVAILAAAFLFLIAFCPGASHAKAWKCTDPETGRGALIADEANLLTDAGKEALMEVMVPALEHGNIMFLTSGERHTDSTQYFAESKYKKYFGYESGTCLLIDLYKREIFIFSDGENLDVLTRAKARSITDNCYKYATDGDYYKCAEQCFLQIIDVLNGIRIPQPMKIASNAILSVLAGMLICAIIVISTMRVKKAQTKELRAVSQDHLSLARTEICRAGITKMKNNADVGRRVRGLGGSGGGGHSGGGGGHRF